MPREELSHKLIRDLINLANPPVNIFIIDNASGENRLRSVKLQDCVTNYYNKTNKGFARAANQGWLMGNSSLVLFINPDVRLLQKDYTPMMQYIATHHEVGAIGPRVLNQDGTTQGSARGFHSFWTFLAGRKGPLTKFFPKSKIVSKDLPLLNYIAKDPLRVDWVSGACVLIKRRVLEEVGGFDTRFFMYFEDASICKDMLALGFKTYYFPEALVSHRIGASSESKPIKALWWFHQSWYRYLCKYHLRRHPIGQAVAANITGLRFCMVLFSRLLRIILRIKR